MSKERVPKKMRERYEAIVALTDEVCAEHLNDEYATMCRKLAAKLSRKRPSPLERGWAKSWAAAILYTLARVNFLFDQSRTPHWNAEDLAKAFGVSKSTASNKARDIEDMLEICIMDPDWTLPSQMDDNPRAWMDSVNGFIVDA